MSLQPKSKRKRGRPKKNTTNNDNVKKSKRKNLKSKKYSLLETQKTNPQKIIDSVLVHLPINIDKFQKKDVFFSHEFMKYDENIPIEPQPYDPKSNNNNIFENIDNKNKEKKDEVVIEKNYNIHNKNNFVNKNIKTILVQFDDFNKINQWPNTIDIKCWWCCHNFDNTPCGIPIKYKSAIDTFYVYGCFCSFNCALSYNFQTKSDKKWERAGLIQLLYNKSTNTDEEITYAPERECLKDFGGYMTINEFRNKQKDKEYKIIYPPMLSVIPQIEEIKIIKETNRENDFQEKLNLVSQKMKIQNKLKNKRNMSIFLKAKDKQKI